VEQFRLAHAVDAVQDFNHYLALNPDQIPHHWQRGIAYYYCDRFSEGRQQFELHQSVNPQDVENAAWHFFCVARVDGVEKARSLLMPVSLDSRVPMMQIHALLAGQGKPEDVLAAATAGNPSAPTQQRQLFYAHLYLGLYYEALQDAKQSREHIDQAVKLAGKYDYMGIVARVHATLRKASPKAR
jgi:lipoprotein NlpI